MNAVERFRESPARYAVPWGMTLSRPMFGELGRRAARRGEWGKAALWFGLGGLSDFEGRPAEYFNATSELGAKADPAADAVFRVQALDGIRPEMPITAWLVFAGEAYIAKVNAEVQKEREKPYVPFAAKAGSAAEFVGFGLAAQGIRTDSLRTRNQARAALFGGLGLRMYGYLAERQRMRYLGS